MTRSLGSRIERALSSAAGTRKNRVVRIVTIVVFAGLAVACLRAALCGYPIPARYSQRITRLWNAHGAGAQTVEAWVWCAVAASLVVLAVTALVLTVRPGSTAPHGVVALLAAIWAAAIVVLVMLWVSGVPFSNFTAREENAANYVGALTYPVIVLGLIVFFVLLSLRSGRAAARR